MRHFEIGFRNGDTIDPNDVDIESARTPTNRTNAIRRRFQPMAHTQQFARAEIGVELNDDIEEWFLIGATDRLCPIHRRHGNNRVKRTHRFAKKRP